MPRRKRLIPFLENALRDPQFQECIHWLDEKKGIAEILYKYNQSNTTLFDKWREERNLKKDGTASAKDTFRSAMNSRKGKGIEILDQNENSWVFQFVKEEMEVPKKPNKRVFTLLPEQDQHLSQNNRKFLILELTEDFLEEITEQTLSRDVFSLIQNSPKMVACKQEDPAQANAFIPTKDTLVNVLQQGQKSNESMYFDVILTELDIDDVALTTEVVTTQVEDLPFTSLLGNGQTEQIIENVASHSSMDYSNDFEQDIESILDDLGSLDQLQLPNVHFEDILALLKAPPTSDALPDQYLMDAEPDTLSPNPSFLEAEPDTLSPNPSFLEAEPDTLSPNPSFLDAEPDTLSPNPSFLDDVNNTMSDNQFFTDTAPDISNIIKDLEFPYNDDKKFLEILFPQLQ